jgi:hypothetical protein
MHSRETQSNRDLVGGGIMPEEGGFVSGGVESCLKGVESCLQKLKLGRFRVFFVPGVVRNLKATPLRLLRSRPGLHSLLTLYVRGFTVRAESCLKRVDPCLEAKNHISRRWKRRRSKRVVCGASQCAGQLGEPGPPRPWVESRLKRVYEWGLKGVESCQKRVDSCLKGLESCLKKETLMQPIGNEHEWTVHWWCSPPHSLNALQRSGVCGKINLLIKLYTANVA